MNRTDQRLEYLRRALIEWQTENGEEFTARELFHWLRQQQGAPFWIRLGSVKRLAIYLTILKREGYVTLNRKRWRVNVCLSV